MVPATHLAISQKLCGVPIDLSEGRARVALVPEAQMVVDDRGLVHGGFVFGLADHAAMLAVNDPYVVLGAAACKFLRPVLVDDNLEAEAVARTTDGKKRAVDVTVTGKGEVVFEGEFTCFVLDQHVTDR